MKRRTLLKAPALALVPAGALATVREPCTWCGGTGRRVDPSNNKEIGCAACKESGDMPDYSRKMSPQDEEAYWLALAFIDHFEGLRWKDVRASTELISTSQELYPKKYDQAIVRVWAIPLTMRRVREFEYRLERCDDPGPERTMRHNIYKFVGQPWKVCTMRDIRLDKLLENFECIPGRRDA